MERQMMESRVEIDAPLRLILNRKCRFKPHRCGMEGFSAVGISLPCPK